MHRKSQTRSKMSPKGEWQNTEGEVIKPNSKISMPNIEILDLIGIHRMLSVNQFKKVWFSGIENQGFDQKVRNWE